MFDIFPFMDTFRIAGDVRSVSEILQLIDPSINFNPDDHSSEYSMMYWKTDSCWQPFDRIDVDVVVSCRLVDDDLRISSIRSKYRAGCLCSL